MIKARSLAVQVLLMVVTFGIYSLYWFYRTAQEMKTVQRDDAASPALWLVLVFVPFAAFYSLYKYGELYEKF